MPKQGSDLFNLAAVTAQTLSRALLIAASALLVIASISATLGLLPWPEISLRYGQNLLPAAGMWLQLGLTLVSIMLLSFLPTHRRMSRLEQSHRSFAMGVEDVARAYRIAHEADRAETFSLSSEFDSIRARMEHLRAHPDLRQLEPDLLQLAAVMSHQSRDLANIYSDANLGRAKRFLRERQEEVERLNAQIATARATCEQLRRWTTEVTADEAQAQQQIRRLEADLRETLPELGYDFETDERPDTRDGNVVPLPVPTK